MVLGRLVCGRAPPMPNSFSSDKPVNEQPQQPVRVRAGVRVGPKFAANGRPNKRNAALEKALLKAISAGAPYKIACLACGISEDAFAEWRRRDPAFQKRVDEASGRMALRLLGKIEEHAKEFFAPAAWMLERRFPTEFSRPEVQLLAQHHHMTLNSLSINVSEGQARELETRSASVTTQVAKLFEAWKERAALPQADAPDSGTAPDPEQPSVYGAILPPAARPHPE